MYLLDINLISETRNPRPHPQVIPADAAVFRRWGELIAGRSPHLVVDALLAATAEVHGLTMVSRNVRDFRALGIEAVDPFAP